jgi:iron complex outermembrane receptor protein
MRRILCLSSILVCASSALAHAQDGDVDPVDVINVTSSPLTVGTDEIAGAVEVVTREHIESHLAGSLADTIAHHPGVSTTYFGPASSRPVIRGLGTDRVRVLVNGVGLIDASTASPDHAVASEALEAQSVEILRGPAAIAYGGGAIGGVVNVIDGRIPEERAEGPLEGRFYAGMTTVDDGETAAGRVRFNVGEFVFNIEALTRNADDYDIPGFAESELFHLLEEAEEDHDDDHDDDDHEEEGEAFGTIENSGLQFDSASFGASWIGENSFIGFAVKRTEALYGIPGGHAHEEEDHDDDHDDAKPLFMDDDDDHDEHGHEEGGVRIDLEQTRYDVRAEVRDLTDHIDRIRISVGAGDYTHTELEGDEIGTVFINEGLEGRAEIRFSPHDLWGGEWEGAGGVQAFRRDFSAVGAEAFVPPSVTDDWGLFFVERWDAGDWGLEGGIRVENREIETAALSRNFDTQSLSGSLFWRPQESTFIAITLSSAERAPTDVELFADGPHLATGTFERGDPTLGVEEATSIELTLRTDFGNWAFESAVFSADYDGFIGEFPTGAEEDELPVFEFRQDDVTLSGFEARLEGPLGSVGGWELGGELTAEYVDGDVDSGGNLPLLPPLGVGAGVSASSGMHDVGLDVQWHDVQDNTAAFELKSRSYVLVNASWSMEPFENRDLRVIFEGRNLGDQEARLHTSVLKDTVPLPGRNFRAALVLDF